MSTEIAKLESQSAARMAIALKEKGEMRSVLKSFIDQHMDDGPDYGVIPGTQNPTLLQPGAEKLADIFQCTQEYEIIKAVEDWDSGLFFYTMKCRLLQRDTNQYISEGIGACSTYESKYRWRNANRVCPHCGKPAIIKGREEYGGGYVCFKKKDGCGATFAEDDKSITEQVTGQIQNPNIADTINTVQKMAKKRCLVDAAISLARRYGFKFTQDTEDMSPDELGHHKPTTASNQEPKKEAPREQPKQEAKQAPQAQPQANGKISPQQLKELNDLCKKAGANVTAACQFLKIKDLSEMPFEKYEGFTKKLKERIAEAEKAEAESAAKKAQEEAAKPNPEPAPAEEVETLW